LDRDGACFTQGISDDLPDQESLLRWLREVIGELEHVKEVYCFGTSGGAYAALYFGYHLSAEAVWAFSPRIIYPRIMTSVKESFIALAQSYLVRDAKKRNSSDPDNQDVLDNFFDIHARREDGSYPPAPELTDEVREAYDRFYLEIEGNSDQVVDTSRVSQLTEFFDTSNRVTQYSLYYCPENIIDRIIPDHLAGKAGVGVEKVAIPKGFPVEDYPAARVTKAHSVIHFLYDQGKLQELFPEHKSS
jgi:hypothetical protein